MRRSVIPLKDLCNDFRSDIVDGPFGSNLKREHYLEHGVPVLKIQNIRPFKISLKDMDFVSEEKFAELDRHSYQEGDIIMTKLGDPLGESAIVQGIGSGLIVADLVRIRASKIDTKYLCYHLNSPVTNDFINAQQKGSTRPRVKISVVRELPIYAPSIEEQKRIVSILDKAFAEIDRAIELTEKNLQNARYLFDSYLNRVFIQQAREWPKKRLQEIALDFGRGKSKHRPRNDPSLFVGDYPFIQTGDVRNCHRRISTYSNSYNEKGLAQSKLWPAGTICVTIAANIAETGIMGFEGCFPDSIIGIVVKPKEASSEYVEYLLQSVSVLLKSKGKGAAQDNINLGTFENLKFPFPEIDIQKSIVSDLNIVDQAIEEVSSLYLTKIAHLRKLKKSILQKAFSGKFTEELTEETVS
jgi:type I restriction enzyme S subunit